MRFALQWAWHPRIFWESILDSLATYLESAPGAGSDSKQQRNTKSNTQPPTNQNQ